MYNVFSRVLGCILPVVLLALSAPAHAEFYMKYRHHTEGYQVMGHSQPAEESIREIWIGKDKVRTNEGDQSTLLDTTNNTVTSLDHTTRSYSVMKPGDFKGSLQSAMGEEGQSEEASMAMEGLDRMPGGMMSAFKMSVTETGERKKIGDWNSTKYLMGIGMGVSSSEAEVWATRDIKVDMEVYHAMAKSFMADGGIMGDVVKELEKIQGVHVLTISTADIMGLKVKSTEELLEVKHVPVPSDFFQVPAGYTHREYP